MIHPKAVKEFIKRVRDSHDWMKKLSHKELDVSLKAVGFKAVGKKPLMHHQKVCILLGIAYRCFAFWLDMGTGKTRVSLELLNYWYQNGEIKWALIEAPSEDALVSWEDEIKEWGIKIPYITLKNSASTEKWRRFHRFKCGLVLATYPGLVRMVSKKVKVKGKKKSKLMLDKSLMSAFFEVFDAVVLDEATFVGNHGSLAYKFNDKLVDYVKMVYELAGLPFGRDPHLMWSQLFLVDRGETLGDTLGMFRAAFFKTKRNFWGGYEHKFKKTKKKELRRIVRHRSITYGEGECFDLPPLVKKVEQISLPQAAEPYIKRYLKQIKSKHAGFVERKNAFIRMRQVSSGFIGMKNDLTGDKINFAFAENPKLDRAIELIQSVPTNRKFIIAYEFIPSGKMISAALKKAKIKHVVLGGQTKDSRVVQDAFKHDPSVRGIVLSHRKGAFALNLQRGNYLFIYESPVGVIQRKQLERRPRRKGQRKTVFQYDLVVIGTMDSRILQFHKEGKDLFKAIIRSKGKVLERAA